ncbi:hypothetical protein ACIF6L_34235 [Kitasatospora sp. NPDC086009]|uniref:hypothetical protein n=1 Tax=unclassified Kitasatospora TaxID=2633591 RepID=UPI0037C7EE7C
MTTHAPDQPAGHDDDGDLVFPTLGPVPPLGPDEPNERPDLIWHPEPRRRLRNIVPLLDRYPYLTDAGFGLAALGVLASVVLLVLAVGPYVLATGHWLLDPANVATPAAQVWHTVDDPIHRSLAERGQGLPAGPATLYTAWAATGLLILWRGLRTAGSAGAQLGAVTFGAVTAVMVWDGTPGPGRPVAAGLAALLWAALVALALTGSWITTHTTVVNEVTVEPSPASDISVAAPEPVPVTIQVTVPEPRIETVLVVDRDGRRTSRPDDH